MFIDEHGHGPAVVLLHGILGYTLGFAPLVTRLQARRQLLIPDLPGYGRTAAVEGRYEFARVNTLLEDELLARGVRECAVVGHSAGGYRAILLALGARVKVTHLVTLGGVAGIDAPEREAFRDLARQIRAGFDLKKVIVDLVTVPGFAERHPSDACDLLAAAAAAPDALVCAEYDAFAGAPDLRARLGELTCPVVARVGALDKATPVAWSEAIAAGARWAVLQVVNGAAHCLLQEDQEATVAAVVAAIGA